MGFYKHVIILLFVLINQYSCNIENPLENYLLNRYQDVRSKLIGSFSKYNEKFRDVQINITVLDTHIIRTPQTPICFNILNDTYILLKNKICTLTLIDGDILLREHYTLPKVKQEILFIKTFEYESAIFIIAVFKNGYSNIYTFHENTWTLIQSIDNPGYVIDVAFLIQNDFLYLFVVHNRYHAAYEPSNLYKFTGTQFVEVNNILTIAASSIAFFKNKNSHIVVITQTPSNSEQAGTYVLNIDNSQIIRKNFLNSNGADTVLTYLLNGERYILVVKKGVSCIIYWWDGDYFLKWKQLRNLLYFERAYIYYIRNQPVLFIAKQSELIMYNIDTENMHIITSISFNRYYWQILKIDYELIENSLLIYVTALLDINIPEIFMISVNIDTIESLENSVYSDDSLVKCYSTLNENLKFRSDLLKRMHEKSKKILQVNKSCKINGIITSKYDPILRNSVIHNIVPYKFFKNTQKPLYDKLEHLKNKIKVMHQNIKMQGPVIIKGKLDVETLSAPVLNAQKINNNLWKPDMWLSKSKDQIITVPVFGRVVVAKQLTIQNKNHFLNDLFTLNGNQIFTGNCAYKSIMTKNITTNRINFIPVEKMYQKSKSPVVKGAKYFNIVSANNVQTKNFNEKTAENMLHFMENYISYDFHKIRVLTLNNFNFEVINDINWKQLNESIIKLQTENIIKGDVVLYTNVTIKNLITKKILNRNASDLITKTTDQIITADMQLMDINVKNIICSNINGMSLKKRAATFKNNFITGPVTINSMHVSGNVNGFHFPVDKFKDTVKFHDYIGHVKIKGSLTLTNVSLNGITEMRYKNEIIPSDYMQEYWLKNQNQVISTHVTALDGLSVKDLNTTYINDVSFVTFSTNFIKDDSLEYNFKNIHVMGDFYLPKNTPDLAKIARLLNDSVRKHGRYTISGHKYFKNALKIHNLETVVLDNTFIKDIARANKFNKFTGTKHFQNLILNENLDLTDCKKLTIKEINNFPIIDLLNRTVFINKPAYINNLILEKPTKAKNLIFYNANGENVDAMTEKVLHIFSMDRLNKVFISENMSASEISATNVNDIDIENYLADVVSTKNKIIIKDKINFKNNLYVNNLNTEFINDMNVKKIPETYLCHRQDQTIKGEFRFDDLQTPQLITPAINKMNTSNFIDKTSKKDIHLNTNLFITSLTCQSVTSKSFTNNLKDIAHNLESLPSTKWSNITVLRDIHFSKAGGNFGRIIAKAVNKLHSNTITEQVNFKYVHANKINLLKSKINNVNITYLYNDALKNNENNQIVSGHNKFNKFTATRMKIKGNANIKRINGVDILHLNRTIFDIKNINKFPIKGHKVFTSEITVSNLKVPPKIHRTSVNNLVTSKSIQDKYPNVRFKKLKIMEYLDVPFIKNVNITNLLNNSMKCHTNSPQYIYSTITFKNLHFAGNITTKSINNIELRNVICDHGEQFIQNTKRFENLVHVYGDFEVKLLNNYKLSTIYKNAILANTDVIIDNNLVFRKPTSIYADVECKKINGESVAHLLAIVGNGTKIQTNKTVNAFQQMKVILDEYLYLITDNSTLT